MPVTISGNGEITGVNTINDVKPINPFLLMGV